MRLDHLLSKENVEKARAIFRNLGIEHQRETGGSEMNVSCRGRTFALFSFLSLFRRKAGWSEERSVEIYGGIAQMGEHLPCKQGVMSSNLIISTR